MVTMPTVPDVNLALLPEPDDEVLVRWGLIFVPGRVWESHTVGDRCTALVVLDAGVFSDEPTTASLPIQQLQPGESAHSPWAEQRRYEQRIAAALTEAFGPGGRARPGVVRDEDDIDLAVSAPDGRKVVVEVRPWSSAPSGRARDRILRWLRSTVRAGRAAGVLLVAPIAVEDSGTGPVRTVRWSSPDDDAALVTAVESLLGSE